MAGDPKQKKTLSEADLNNIIEQVGAQHNEKLKQGITQLSKSIFEKGMTPKDAMGLTDEMVEGIYGQAYRLYNNGKYADAAMIFRLLVLLNVMESKYTMGLASCLHMQKRYDSASKMYAMAAVIDGDNPLPHYHMSDCFMQQSDIDSAIISLQLAAALAGERPEYAILKDRALMNIESLEKQLQEGVKK